MRFPFIDSVKKAYPLCLLCKVMQVSRSGYYNWRNRRQSARDVERARLIPMVKEIHKASRGTYGSRRMAKKLESTGTYCGKHKAGTLMKRHGIRSSISKKGDCWDTQLY